MRNGQISRRIAALAIGLVIGASADGATRVASGAATATIAASAPRPDAQDNVSGTWSGTLIFKGADPYEEPIHLVLKQDTSTLTGTGGPDGDHQYRITKGRVGTNGGATTATFDLIINAVLTSFDVKLGDGALRGMATTEGEDGQKRVATVELKRSQN